MRKTRSFSSQRYFCGFYVVSPGFRGDYSIAAASGTHSSLKTGTEVAFDSSDSSSTMFPISSVVSSANDSGFSVADSTIGTDDCSPRISGAVDKEIVVGDSISYRTGVSVVDDSDEIVALGIDSDGVDFPHNEDLRWDFRVTLYNTRFGGFTTVHHHGVCFPCSSKPVKLTCSSRS